MLIARPWAMVQALLFVATGVLAAQDSSPAGPHRQTVLAAARDIIREARYATLVTIAADGQPQARIVDPFAPDSTFTVWIATNPATRKVGEIRRNSRVTLLYFNAPRSEYVTLIGTAQVDTTAAEKARH